MSDTFITDPVGSGEPSLVERLRASPTPIYHEAQQQIVGLTYHRDLLNQTIADLRVALGAARAEWTQLHADKARVDFLDRNARIRGRALAIMERGADHEPIRWAGIEWGGEDGQTVREAIDAATKETS